MYTKIKTKIKNKDKEKTQYKINNKTKEKSKKKNFELIQDENEPVFFYDIRKSFVELLNNKNKKDFELHVMYSHIFINMMFLKCRYQPDTEEFINNFLKKYDKKFLYKISIF